MALRICGNDRVQRVVEALREHIVTEALCASLEVASEDGCPPGDLQVELQGEKLSIGVARA